MRRRRQHAAPQPALRRFQARAIELDRREDNRTMAAAVTVALLLHLTFLTLRLPAVRAVLEAPEPEVPVFRLTNQRLAPPEVRPVETPPVPPLQAREVPVPEVLMAPPEPLPMAAIEPIPLVPAGPGEIEIPIAAPPAPPSDAPIRFGGDMTRPVRVSGEIPAYTNAARVRGVEGVVVLEAVIDRGGEIAALEVLKGLPFGLEQSAVKAVRDWRFEPATLAGEAVDVLYTLTVRFTIR